MYVVDGIAYAGEAAEGLAVTACRSVGDGILAVTFSTGETRLFDATCLLDMPAFAPLADFEVVDAFALEDGVLTWLDGQLDIAPQAVYARSCEYHWAA